MSQEQAGWIPVPVSPCHLVRGEVSFLLCFFAIQITQSGHLAPAGAEVVMVSSPVWLLASW